MTRVDDLLEMWARWIQNGCNQSGGFSSIFEMMMVTRGQFSGSSEPNDSIETRIEGAVSLLTQKDRQAATVLRVEFGAWPLRDVEPNARQIDKAHAMRMPLRTYKHRLHRARRFVAECVRATL